MCGKHTTGCKLKTFLVIIRHFNISSAEKFLVLPKKCSLILEEGKTCLPKIVFVSSVSVSTGDESFVIKLRDSKQQFYCTVCHDVTLISSRSILYFPKTDTSVFTGRNFQIRNIIYMNNMKLRFKKGPCCTGAGHVLCSAFPPPPTPSTIVKSRFASERNDAVYFAKSLPT